MFSRSLLAEIRPLQGAADLSSRAVAIDNLVFVYHMIVASESILHECAKTADAKTRRYFAAHLQEEKNHAQWLKDDIECAGASVYNDVLMACAACAAGAQLYYARHVNPIVVLGYMAVLECFPMPIPIVNELERHHGEILFRTLRHHAIHDVAHGAELIRELDDVPTSLQGLVRMNALMTVRQIAHVATMFGSFNSLS